LVSCTTAKFQLSSAFKGIQEIYWESITVSAILSITGYAAIAPSGEGFHVWNHTFEAFMRILNTIFVPLLFGAAVSGAADLQKSKLPVIPKRGVKTPGVQIPFENLKPEIEYATPANPAWIAVTDNVLLPDPAKNGIARIDPKAKENKFLDSIADVSKPCGGVVNAFNFLWAAACGDGSLLKIDAKTAKIVSKHPFGTGSAPGILAASSDSLWMITDDKSTLSRIDPQQAEVVGEFRLPSGCGNLIFAETALWIACATQNKILRINAESGLVEKAIDVSAQPKSLVAGEGSIWALCAKDGKIDRIDPKTNKVSKTIDLLVPGVDGSLAFGEGALWVSMADFPLARINPQTEQVAQQFYGEGGGAIQVGQGFIWLSNTGKGTLWKIDPKRVLATLAE